MLPSRGLDPRFGPLAAREEERARIADDLHDGLAQLLHATLQQVRVARRANGRDSARVQQCLSAADDLLVETLGEIRRTVQGLRPRVLEQAGLVAAVERAAAVLRQAAAPLRVSVTIQSSPERLPAAVQLVVYRVLQEALENVRKHARAQSVSVLLAWHRWALRLEVTDDGVGPTSPSPRSGGRLGLASMRQHAAALGGSLEVEPASDAGGTLLRLSIPLAVDQAGPRHRRAG